MEGFDGSDILLNAIEENGIGTYPNNAHTDNSPEGAIFQQDDPELEVNVPDTPDTGRVEQSPTASRFRDNESPSPEVLYIGSVNYSAHDKTPKMDLCQKVNPAAHLEVNPPDAPYARMVEQPAPKLRFRFDCEGRMSDVLYGESSTKKDKFPTLEVGGYVGPAVCQVSLVEHAPPYRVHPNDIVGKQGHFHNGICTLDNPGPDMRFSFVKIGIHVARKKEKKTKLNLRREMGVDPFNQGFAHKVSSIDTSLVRLCFQVTLKTAYGDVKLAPVVSNVIKDKRIHPDPAIVNVSDQTSPVSGGKKILVFCNKIRKGDIEVHFVQSSKSGQKLPIGKVRPTAASIHNLTGISLLTPAYPLNVVTKPVRCKIYLYVPSTGTYSKPVDFTYLPNAELCRNCSISAHQNHQTPTLKRHHQREEQELSAGQLAVPALRRSVSDQSHALTSHRRVTIEKLLAQIVNQKPAIQQGADTRDAGMNRFPEDILDRLDDNYPHNIRAQHNPDKDLPNLHLECGDLSGSTVDDISEALESGLHLIENQAIEAPLQPLIQRNNLNLD